MSKSLQAIRGMKDILPAETPLWRHIEGIAREVIESYGYREIRVPIVEATELFERSIGDATDIVEKEMYTFADRNGDSLTLRPEGTAGCVRAGLEHGLLHNQTQRLWYLGPMFRHEKPQKGRYRQFHQIGVEAFGYPGPDIDAELVFLTARLWRELGLRDLRLEVNSLGTPAARNAHRSRLQEYFRSHYDALDDDSRRRLDRNPLRILDSKNPSLAPIIAAAPTLESTWDDESRAHFEGFLRLLHAADLPFVLNPRLVRGLDYYTLTVFEWTTNALGAQGTVCAGGRYDGLVSQFGAQATPGIGFAMGLERLVALLEPDAGQPALGPAIYLVALGTAAIESGLVLAESLRLAPPRPRIEFAAGGGSLKSQMKRADRSGAALALILGDNELAAGAVAVKFLRRDLPQRTVPIPALPAELARLLIEAGVD